MSRVGLLSVLLLALSAGGVGANDWMSMVQPADYFKARNIIPTMDRMIDLAIADIDSPKAQIRQLAALKHLFNEADAFKKAENYATNRMAIEEVLDGRRGKDPTGFGQEYAKRLLAKLDGAKLAQPKSAPLRQDALNWFPADVKLAAALDMQQMQDISNDAQKGLLAKLPEQLKLTFYDQLEATGILRIDRMEFGLSDANKQGEQKILLRLTGKGNQAWLAKALIERASDQFEEKKFKDADGTPIITLSGRSAGAIFVLIGNTEFIAAGYTKFDGRHEDVVAELLAVRAKSKPHAGSGPLKDRLAKIPDKAIGFLVGDLPGTVKEEIGRKINPVPAKIAAHVERSPMGLDLKAEFVMKDGMEAGKVMGAVAALGKESIAGLQQAMMQPPQPGMPQVPFQSLINLLQTVQTQNQAERVQLSGFVTNNLIQELGEMYVRIVSRAPIAEPQKDFKQ